MNQYENSDGTPRFGSRSADHAAVQEATAPAVRVEETAEAAASLGLDDMAAAIDRRLTSSWSDAEDPLVAELRSAHPEELAAARALVKLHLGSQRQWRLKAEAVRNTSLASLTSRRKASGSALEIMLLRLGLLVALIAPPVFVVATSPEDILKLVLAGASCIVSAFIGGHFIAVRSRVPVMPNIRAAWLGELREDIVNATLVAILQNKGQDLKAQAVEAGQQGWKSIQVAAKAVAALRG